MEKELTEYIVEVSGLGVVARFRNMEQAWASYCDYKRMSALWKGKISGAYVSVSSVYGDGYNYDVEIDHETEAHPSYPAHIYRVTQDDIDNSPRLSGEDLDRRFQIVNDEVVFMEESKKEE